MNEHLEDIKYDTDIDLKEEINMINWQYIRFGRSAKRKLTHQDTNQDAASRLHCTNPPRKGVMWSHSKYKLFCLGRLRGGKFETR